MPTPPPFFLGNKVMVEGQQKEHLPFCSIQWEKVDFLPFQRVCRGRQAAKRGQTAQPHPIKGDPRPSAQPEGEDTVHCSQRRGSAPTPSASWDGSLVPKENHKAHNRQGIRMCFVAWGAEKEMLRYASCFCSRKQQVMLGDETLGKSQKAEEPKLGYSGS